MRKKNIFFILFNILIILNISLYAKRDVIESQPEIIFNYDKLKKKQDTFVLQFDFNKAVLLMEKKEYKKAIEVFKQTAKTIKIPSFLNIAIGYYKLGEIDNAKLYLNNIYNYKKAIFKNTYSYMSACYYLYQITKDNKYLEIIIDIAKKHKDLTEHSKRMLADTFIILKEYQKALTVLDSMKFALDLKKGLLYLKLKDYVNAEIFLKRAKDKTYNQYKIDKINWIMVLRDLKANDLEKLKENLDLIKKRKSSFKANQELPLEIYFNKNKYSPKDYLSFVSNFSYKREIDFIYYFAPFVFSDSQEIIYDISKGFVFKTKQNVESLEKMVEYNANFIDIIKADPIIRVSKLKELIKEDTKSYVYYNLALSCAQIYDFHNAFKYFQQAYKLNPGNKLYSVMTLITAKRIGKKVTDKDYLESNIKSKTGLYKYFGQMLYKTILNKSYKVNEEPTYYNKTIFYKALTYLSLKKDNKDTLTEPLLLEHGRDPFVYLLKLIKRRDNESDYRYFSRLQDRIPLFLNDNFLEGPLIVTEYYMDVLKSIGLFTKASFIVDDKITPSYLRTKAVKELYNGNSDNTLNILEKLQNIYKLEDKYTMYLIVAALLDQGKYNEASIQISLIKAILNDNGADFLSGVQLIQDLKISSAKQYFHEKYLDDFIDFKLVNIDKFLESL